MKKYRISLGTFEWKSGTINDHIIKLALEAVYNYQYHFMTLQIGFTSIWHKAEYKHIEGDTYEAYFEA